MEELEVVKKMQKKYGEGAVVRMDSAKVEKIEAIPTGSLLLDYAIGVGGVPRGRIIEVYGMESSGKTTVCLQTAAEAQKMSMNVAYIDVENALDIFYAKRLGVDIEKLYISQPDSAEEALDIVENYVRSGDFGLIIIDSIAALVPRAENEGEMGDSVSGDTPIFIKRNNAIDIVPIEDLYGGYRKFSRGRHSNRYLKFAGKNIEPLQVLTASGWKKIKCVFLKENHKKKPIVLTHTNYGLAKTTPDHSLFVNGVATSPNELKIGDLIDTYPVECNQSINSVTEDVAWLIGYFCAEGSLGGRTVVFADTHKQFIDEAEMRAKRSLCVATSIAERIPDSPNKKLLYNLRLSTKDEVYAMFSQCFTKRNRYKKVPDFILNANPTLKRAFLEGFNLGDGNLNVPEGTYRLYTSSFVLSAGLQHILRSIGIDGYASVVYRDDNSLPEITLGSNSNQQKRYADNEIKSFRTIDTPEFLYDMETEDGTFVGGLGCIVHHNSHMGLQARLMSQAMRKLQAQVRSSNTTLLFVNQIRQKIGIVYGSNETTPGGNAMKFAASVRVKLTRSNIKKGDEIVGSTIKARIEKNKVAVPFRVCEMEIIFNEGISKMAELVDLGVQFGFVTKRGAFYSIDDTKLGQGKDAAKSFLKENPDIAAKLEAQIRGHMAKTQTGLVLDSDDDEIEVDEETGEIL